jgi:hypothetical protein
VSNRHRKLIRSDKSEDAEEVRPSQGTPPQLRVGMGGEVYH